MRRLVLPFAVVIPCLVSCAANDSNHITNRGYLASLQVVQPIIPHTPMPELEMNQRASDYLQLGLSHFNDNKRIEAIRAFARALATGDLNNQGRALAYWHLFLSHRDEALPSLGAEALTSFVTVSRLLLQQSADNVEGEDLLEHVNAFIDRFELRDRLLLAEVTLEAIWAQKDASYGRTAEHPVMLGEPRAQRLFLHVFKPCQAKENPEQAKVRIARAAKMIHNQPVDEATITCPGEKAAVSMFFTEAQQ